MQRLLTCAVIVLLLATAVYGAAFTPGNFLIVYANTATASMFVITILQI
jgi:hypothetical protein